MLGSRSHGTASARNSCAQFAHRRLAFNLGRMTDSVERLYDAVLEARDSDPVVSRTARLFRAGRSKIAKKLAEEAIEVVIDAVNGDRNAVVRESADLLYNLVVVWAAAGVRPSEVWKEMERREGLFGIAEKLMKRNLMPKNRAKPQAAPQRRVRHRQ
jgi:phosphoribosyl-ATP pyrophosphohydrolase